MLTIRGLFDMIVLVEKRSGMLQNNKLKKVVDKAITLWYTKWAVENDSEQTKNIRKKFLTNRTASDILNKLFRTAKNIDN